MQLLKSRRGWLRFMREDVGVHGSQLTGYAEPASYPCYGYAVVQSYAYEEQRPLYLYPDDLIKMQRELARATPATAEAEPLHQHA